MPGQRQEEAQRQRQRLVLGEHQRRQVIAGPQAVADAGFAVDGNTRQQQITYIAIDRPRRDFEPFGKLGCRGQAPRPQMLNDLEQPVGAAHAGPSSWREGRRGCLRNR